MIRTVKITNNSVTRLNYFYDIGVLDIIEKIRFKQF